MIKNTGPGALEHLWSGMEVKMAVLMTNSRMTSFHVTGETLGSSAGGGQPGKVGREREP